MHFIYRILNLNKTYVVIISLVMFLISSFQSPDNNSTEKKHKFLSIVPGGKVITYVINSDVIKSKRAKKRLVASTSTNLIEYDQAF